MIKKCEAVRIKNLNDPKAFIEYSNTMDVYNNINDYNPNRNRKILIVFDDTIADIMAHKKLWAIIKELSIRCRKSNISFVFIAQSYFSVPKEVRLNSTHCLIMKIHYKIEIIKISKIWFDLIIKLLWILTKMYKWTILFSEYWYYITCWLSFKI